MKAKEHPSQETLIKYFDLADGLFVRKIRTGYKTKIGDVVNGYIMTNGRLCMKFNNEHFSYHRLIWIYINGDIPEGYEIDHIDCNPLNNDISNLRLATSSNNKHNLVFSGNSSGYKDICLYTKKKNGKEYSYYMVGVKLNNKVKRKNFEYSDSGLLDAIAYRDKQILELHGEFGRLK